MTSDSLFIEQAEYINPEDFIEWSSEHPNEEVILKKLTQAGAKLLTGPRGCGKTTLMLKAYNKLNSSKNNGAFPIYVNFKLSLKLEPLYKSKANGGYWFSQWMYLKIYEGIYKSLEGKTVDKDTNFHIKLIEIEKAMSLLELGEINREELTNLNLSTYILNNDINIAMNLVNKSRCVLFLDDAAHAFAPEQQHDFFEFFRKIKSRNISPKAAIYPGVTNFSPTFNIGHDAEEINAWINPEDDNYFAFMIMMLRKRLPVEVFEKLTQEESLLSIMCYASFGIPRMLLNMVRNMYVENEEDGQITYEINFTRTNVLKEVKVCTQNVMSIYSSLELKLPIYKHFVEVGNVVFSRMINLIKTYNKDKHVGLKSITVAIKKETNLNLKKIIGFYQYAGLVSEKGQISKGEKGIFDLYLINLSFLIDSNALFAAKKVKTDDLATALKTRNAHAFTRTQADYLLQHEECKLSLSLPPCQNCGKNRDNEEARFCSNCGSPLKAASIYEELINKDIDALPLTTTRISGIKNHSNIKKVKDILFDIDHKELNSVPRIGQYWAAKIYYIAEEYIS